MTAVSRSGSFNIACASQVFHECLHRYKTKNQVSVQDIITTLNQYAFGLILIFFSLPNCLPLPPGISSVFSTPLVFFGIQMIMGSQVPWLPMILMRRPIPRAMVFKLMEIGTRLLQRLERYTHPRLILLTGSYAKRFLGIVITLFGLTISLPLPGTNFIPALGVLFIALGLLERDGIAIVIGLVIGGIGVIFTVLVFYFLDVWLSWLLPLIGM